MKPTILTYSGQYFNFLNPDPATILVPDIAHALSNVCRFAGHTRTFYSVAQHVVICSYLVLQEYAFEALHHDDAEYVLGDVTSPLKQLLSDYRIIEHKVDLVIRKKFGLPLKQSPQVKLADTQALAMERKVLLPETANDDEWNWLADVEAPHDAGWLGRIWTPEEAFVGYMNRHCELMGEAV